MLINRLIHYFKKNNHYFTYAHYKQNNHYFSCLKTHEKKIKKIK